jgi:hypothetical protein
MAEGPALLTGSTEGDKEGPGLHHHLQGPPTPDFLFLGPRLKVPLPPPPNSSTGGFHTRSSAPPAAQVSLQGAPLIPQRGEEKGESREEANISVHP